VSHIPPDRRSTHELYEQFREAGQRKAKAQRAARRRTWVSQVPGPALGAVLAFLVVGGGIAVGTKVFTSDEAPLKGDPSPGADVRRAPGARQLAQAVVDDPSVAGARWGVRVYPNDRGDTCVTGGRYVDGRVGREVSGQFREYGTDVQGLCTDLASEHASVVLRSYSVASEQRTLVYGVVDRTVRGVALGPRGNPKPVPVAPDGSYLVVGRGPEAFKGQELVIDQAGGKRAIPL
jgi:hypothetical protein